jgi:hypothetical protein
MLESSPAPIEDSWNASRETYFNCIKVTMSQTTSTVAARPSQPTHSNIINAINTTGNSNVVLITDSINTNYHFRQRQARIPQRTFPPELQHIDQRALSRRAVPHMLLLLGKRG